MELEQQDFDWNPFDLPLIKENSSFAFNNPEGPSDFDAFFLNKASNEVNLPEEIVSTSISDADLEICLSRPHHATLLCPECKNKIKAFQYNEEMSVYMCQNIKVS